jgi:4-amino-4-deoxy-L-arabinose transferase-like glycosyltransferase
MSSNSSKSIRWILASILVAALALHLWGIQRDLPFTPDNDEELFVTPAVAMVATGDLNPHWFGHPGSTVIYPLTAIYRIWNFVAYHGSLLRPDPDVRAAFRANFGQFYLLGRLLAIAYAVLSLPLVYAIGRRVFNTRVALIATGLSALTPIAVAHAQMVRTDSAGTFFTMLSLWLYLRIYDQPTLRNQLLAGAAIGLAIATRYFMVTLVFVLLLVDAIVLWQQEHQANTRKKLWPKIGAGLLVIVVAFALSTPFFFLDFAAAWQDLRAQDQAAHLGADGLSPAGNFFWYLTTAIPSGMTGPQAAFAVIGIILSVRARQTAQRVLLAFLVVYVSAISLSNLHWERWIIQILPLCSLFAAKGLDELAAGLSMRLGSDTIRQSGLVFILTVLLSAWPLYDVILMDIRASHSSSRVLAREWMVQNLPAGSRIAQEWYTAPLAGTGFVVLEHFSLSEESKVESYLRAGYRYAVASSDIYDRFFAEPKRYSEQIAFYQDLFTRGRLLQQWEPSLTRGGPVIRIYELAGP